MDRKITDNPGPDVERDVRRKVQPAHTSGAWSEEPGPVARPDTHDLFRIDDEGGTLRFHVELPPVDPSQVVVDVTIGEINVIIMQNGHDDIYCTIDVPLNADPIRWEQVITPGHLEIVMQKR